MTNEGAMEPNNYADILENLAVKQLQIAEAWISDIPPTGRAALLIEVFRVIDFLHVHKAFSEQFQKQIDFPSFDIMLKGLNCAIHYLLPSITGCDGIPMVESTLVTQNNAKAILYHFGVYVMLKRTADMLKFGIVSITENNNELTVTMTEQAGTDHFLDAIESTKFIKFLERKKTGKKIDEELYREKIEELMKSLVSKWDTGNGIVIGYNTQPEIDVYFEDLVSHVILEWQRSAGIPPTAKFGNISGTQLLEIGAILVSVALKHLHFVLLGIKQIPEANYLMSLTTWRNPATLIENIHSLTGIDAHLVKEAIEFFTIKSVDSVYFLTESTPFIPLLVEVSPNYVLSPIAGIFSNPFSSVRKYGEYQSSITQTLIREPRENWMISDLVAMFRGNKYKVIDKPIDLKSNERFITDIDTAIWDSVANELALFQLKWQDFDTHNIRGQRSRAKNFVTQVDDWVEKIESWIRTYGIDKLLKRMQIQADSGVTIYLFAIGRNASRFRSYGGVRASRNGYTLPSFKFIDLLIAIIVLYSKCSRLL